MKQIKLLYMHIKIKNLLCLAVAILFCSICFTQDRTECKVMLEAIQDTYVGDCVKGFAEGKGEAKGKLHSYKGNFKAGFPNGFGTYYTSENSYHSGNFVNGIKEGKGESHFMKPNMQDSVIKGYWSGDIFQGNEYITYQFSSNALFETKDIRSSKAVGNLLTINIVLGIAGHTSFTGGPTEVLSITSLISEDVLFQVNKKNETITTMKFCGTYEISKFPVKLFGTLSNGEVFRLELYKAANWNVNLIALTNPR